MDLLPCLRGRATRSITVPHPATNCKLQVARTKCNVHITWEPADCKDHGDYN